MECPKAILLYSNLGAWGIPIFETTTYAHICVQKKHKYEVTFFLHRVCFQGEIGPPIFTHIEVINGVFQLSQPMDLTKRLGVIPWIGSVVHIVRPRGCFEVGIELTHLRSQQLFMNWWLIRDPWRMPKKNKQGLNLWFAIKRLYDQRLEDILRCFSAFGQHPWNTSGHFSNRRRLTPISQIWIDPMSCMRRQIYFCMQTYAHVIIQHSGLLHAHEMYSPDQALNSFMWWYQPHWFPCRSTKHTNVCMDLPVGSEKQKISETRMIKQLSRPNVDYSSWFKDVESFDFNLLET